MKHVEKGYRMEKPEGCPQEIHDLMRMAWDLNADLRPTFNQVKQQLAQLKDTPNFIWNPPEQHANCTIPSLSPIAILSFSS